MENGIKIDGISEKSAIAFKNRALKCSDFNEASQKCFSDQELLSKIAILFDKKMAEYDLNILCQGHEWLAEGLDCEVLQPNSEDWQKGSIKMKMSISFEFTPEPNKSTQQQEEIITTESPLDEIRQMV
jgi:KGK domain